MFCINYLITIREIVHLISWENYEFPTKLMIEKYIESELELPGVGVNVQP